MTLTDNAFNLFFAPSIPVTDDILDRAATRYVWAFLNSDPGTTLADPANLLGPNDFSYVVGLAAQIKARSSSARVGYYAGGLASPDSHYPPYDWLSDEDLLHKTDGSPVIQEPALSPAEPGSRRVRVINLSRAATRSKLIGNWISWLQSNGFDGILYDTWEPFYYAAQMTQVWAPTGTLEGATSTSLWWAEQLKAYTSEMTAAFEAVGLEVWSNGLQGLTRAYDPNDPTYQLVGQEQTNVALWNDGVLAEADHQIYLGEPYWSAYLAQAARLEAINGRVFYFHLTQTFWFSDPTFVFGAAFNPSLPDYGLPKTAAFTNAITEGWFHRFYLASYLLIERPGYTLFGFHDEGSYQGYRMDGSEPYLFDGGADWDGDLGAALGAYTTDAVGGVTIYYREFERGFAIVNPSTTSGGSFRVPGLYRAWDAEDGDTYIVSDDAPRVQIPPQTGLILYKIASLISWRLPVRARLYHVVQETDGDVTPNRAVTVYDADGVSAFGQVMYDAPTGGSVVTQPMTDSLGRLTLYAPLGERVKLSISGVAGQQDSEFTIDPEDILTEADAVHLDQYAGDADYSLTIEPTVGGAGGNKIAHFKAEDGTTALKVGPHGVVSTTEVGVTLPVLVIANTNGAPRILANLTDGSYLNRLMVQTSTVGGSSDLGIMPNGGTAGSYTAWATADPANSVAARLKDDIGATASLETLGTGSLAASAHDLAIKPNQNESLRFASNGDVRQVDTILATNAAAGFLYVRTMAGTPSGAPAIGAGTCPIVIDTSAEKIWVRFNTTWKSVALA
jgi:hypothetical protein